MPKVNLLEPKWFLTWLEHTTFTDWLKYLIFDHGKIFNVRAHELNERARRHIDWIEGINWGEDDK